MKKKTIFILSLFILFCFVSPSLSKEVSFPIPFETIDQGAISYYRYDDPAFTGLDMLIKNKNIWAHFWKQHTMGIDPAPPLPSINFGKEMVFVTILGFQTSGGGPGTDVLSINFTRNLRSLHILIEDNETPGPLTVITNPFHIIKLKKINVESTAFEHQRPHVIEPAMMDIAE